MESSHFVARNIGLIACSSRKLGKNEPDKKFRAQDMYIGNTFKKSKNEGLVKFACEDWFILSGKMEYNLLDKDTEISYYNVYLAKQNAEYKKMWTQKIITKLKEKGFDLKNDVFYIFGGSAYYQTLVKYLCHCVVFNFICSNCIDLEQPIYYRNGKKQ